MATALPTSCGRTPTARSRSGRWTARACSAAPFVANPGPSWHAVGTGDFNGDGRSDILWQNADGEVAIWEMNGASADRRRRHRQPRAGLARHRVRRFQWRRLLRHSVAEQQRRGRRLGDERDEPHRRRQPRQSRAELACDRHRRFQRRRPLRHSVAERRRHCGDLGIERHQHAGSLGNPGPAGT